MLFFSTSRGAVSLGFRLYALYERGFAEKRGLWKKSVRLRAAVWSKMQLVSKYAVGGGEKKLVSLCYIKLLYTE